MLRSKMEYYLTLQDQQLLKYHVFGCVSEFPVPFFSPFSWKLHLQASWCPSKTLQNLILRTGEQPSLSASTHYQTWTYYLWVSICILFSTLCTLCFKTSAFFSCAYNLVRDLIPTASSFSVCLSVHLRLFYVCGESSGIRWTRRALKGTDFSQHWMRFGNWNMPFRN